MDGGIFLGNIFLRRIFGCIFNHGCRCVGAGYLGGQAFQVSTYSPCACTRVHVLPCASSCAIDGIPARGSYLCFERERGRGEGEERREKGEGESSPERRRGCSRLTTKVNLRLFQRILHPSTFHHTNLPTYNIKNSATQYSEEYSIILLHNRR